MSAAETTLPTNEDLVAVARFPDPATSNMARSALEAAGIPVFLQGENANSLIPIAFQSRLFVPATNEAEAREILAEFSQSPATLEEVTAAEEGEL